MLNSTPRRKVFNDYAKQLMRRYPSMKEEISVRIQHLNTLWESLLQAVCPRQGYRDEETMLKGGHFPSFTVMITKQIYANQS